MPEDKSIHTEKWDKCVKKKNPNVNPYAICSASIKNAGVKKSHQRKKKKDYYYSKKKKEKIDENKLIIMFSDYVDKLY